MIQTSLANAIAKAISRLNENGPQKDELLAKAKAKNTWFDKDNVQFCLDTWESTLSEENISQWIEPYGSSDVRKKVGIIMAGNLPMVGFHDLISVLLSGHHAVVKLSSDDEVLIPAFMDHLCTILPDIRSSITFVERIKDVDAVIATGSNNSARYFEQYFGHLPNIIRKNRTSLAVITGDESQEQLHALGRDIFQYFGMGCRNVSSIAIPHDFNISDLLRAIEPYVLVMDHHKYANNYTYHKAIWLMDNEVHYDNGFMCFKEKRALHAPLSTMYFWKYNTSADLQNFIQDNSSDLQCIVGLQTGICDVKPGDSQCPALNEYADKVDVMQFLSEL